MKSLETVKSGASGVFFAEFPKSGALVLKSCSNPASVQYATMVLKDLNQFRVPQSRVISYKDAEYKQMQYALDKVSLGNDVLKAQVRANINRPFILLMEYLPGFGMEAVL